MAACGSLQHIFDNPLPENPSLLDSLSWSKITPVKPVDQQPSFTEIFGELHFKENPQIQSSAPSPSLTPITPPMLPSSSLDFSFNLNPKKQKEDDNNGGGWGNITDIASSSSSYSGCHKKSDSFSSMNFESLQLCTEGLGFESSADVEDLKNDENDYKDLENKRVSVVKQYPMWGSYLNSEMRRSRAEAFPPPISSIGKSGKPGVCFKSIREDGRFVLKEIRIPSQEFLHACREDGRLKLHFVQPNDEIPEDEDEDGEAEDDDKVEANKEDDDEDD